MRLRDETACDADAIGQVIDAAFRGMPHAAGTEAEIMRALRAAGALALSLVAEEAGTVVGQAAASPVRIAAAGGWFGIGPVAVAPERQGRGIGTALMHEVLARLRARGAAGAVLTGDPGFYGRIGFAARPGLIVPGVEERYVLACAFGIAIPAGEIVFHPAFGVAPAADQRPLER